MTSGQAIGYMILNNTAIKAIIGTRAYYGDVPATVTTYPQINYFNVSAPYIGGNAENERWQINCRAKTVSEAAYLSYLVRNLFNEYQGAVGSSFEFQSCHFEDKRFIEEMNNIYNHSVDIMFFYIRS
jgi:hypothetical protein